MWWFRIEFILYYAYILIVTFLPYGYLYLIVQTVVRASQAECSSIIKFCKSSFFTGLANALLCCATPHEAVTPVRSRVGRARLPGTRPDRLSSGRRGRAAAVVAVTEEHMTRKAITIFLD